LKRTTTGTPIENHLGEIWNLFNFINPGLLGNLPRFNEKYATPIEKNKDDDARNGLKRILQPFILRRRKDEVLKDLPAKTEIVLDIELSKDERAFYEALRRNAIDNLTNDSSGQGGEKHLKILAEIMRLRRACCNPVLVDKDITISSTKLAVFDEIVDELIDNNHKALVFSQFTSHLALLKAHLDSKGIVYQYLDGSTPAKKRQDLIDKFQGGEGDLFLISLKAGGSGLNLTAADYVIHMDPWWNPAVEDQATDRAHRIGQDKPVTVYRLVTTNTIESKILKLHEHKRDLADQLLTGSDISAKLTADDLLDLLKG
jgi:SNF2 family DNA or RNA helicase